MSSEKKESARVYTHSRHTKKAQPWYKNTVVRFCLLVCFFFFFERACCDAHFPQGVGPFRVLTQTLCPLGLTQTLCPGHWAAAAARTLQNLRNAIVFMGISNSERYLADLTGFWKLPKAIWWKWAEWGGWYSREMLGEGKGRLRHGYKIGPWTGVA